MSEVCIISNYYPPETGAAANRISLLAQGLQNKGFQVSVICPLPNYPTGQVFKAYKGRLYVSEVVSGVKVHRLWMYATNSKNKWKRLFSMLSFSCSLFIFKLYNRIPKSVIIQSPPLIIAHTAIRSLKSKKRKLILNVSDLWPLSGRTLGAISPGLYYKKLEDIERYNYKNTDYILGQSEEIISHIKNCVPNKTTLLYRNYPKAQQLTIPQNLDVTTVKIIYAGLLGVAQGVLELCQHIELTTNCELHIYGDGSEARAIENYIESSQKPIYFHGSLPKPELIKHYGYYHIAIVPLKTTIYGAVPSKIFELAHFGIPLLYMAGGEGEILVERNKLGFTIAPSDYITLNKTLKSLNAEDLIAKRNQVINTARKYFVQETQLQNIVDLINN